MWLVPRRRASLSTKHRGNQSRATWPRATSVAAAEHPGIIATNIIGGQDWLTLQCAQAQSENLSGLLGVSRRPSLVLVIGHLL